MLRIFICRLLKGDVINNRGGLRMDVAAVPVGLEHLFIPAVEGPDAQLNLRKIQRKQDTTFRGHDHRAHPDGVVILARAVLHIWVPGGKAARFRPQRHEVGMYPPGGAVDMPQITVQIGAFDFSPAPVFLHQLKKPGQLRAVLPAPCGHQDHGFIIGSLLILGRGFHHRQAKVFIKITFERRGGGVGPDLHVAD